MGQGESVLLAAAVVGVSFRADLLAEVVGVDRAAVLDSLAPHQLAGTVEFDAAGGRFPDVAVHGEVYAGIAPSERAQLHARVAEVLIGWKDRGRPVDPAEVARHLLASGSDDRRAAEFLVSAGDRAMSTRDYSAAESYYERALDALRLEEDAEGTRASTWIALGRARLALGHLPAARAAFNGAVEPARRAGRGDLLAQAALGLGSGTAGFEVGLVDRSQLDLLEEALAVLPPDDLSLRARVLARLVVALTLVEAERRRQSLAEEAVGLARAAEDDGALISALAAQCDAFSGPEHGALRRRLGSEIVTIARTVGDREMELLGRRHRLVALAEMGDMDGLGAEIRDYAALSDLLGQPLYAWYVPLWRGMRALMAGRTEECRRRLDEAGTIGESAGSHNAVLLTATLRWCLLSETADRAGVSALAEELNLNEEPGVWAEVALALMAAEAGRPEEARTRLDSVAPRLAGAPRDSEWVPMLAHVAELVGHLGSHPVASWTCQALDPFAGLLVVEGIGAAVRGSVHRHLGLLAAALGDVEKAASHFGASLEVHRSLGAPLLVARTFRDWGFALGHEEALREALVRYERLGIAARASEIRDVLDGTRAPDAGLHRFSRDGELWSLTFAGRTVRLRDAKGLRDLARLLASPGRPVPALELATAVAGDAPETAAALEVLHQPRDLGEVLDPAARAAYRRRLRDLDQEISEAEEFADHERAAKAKVERDLLIEQLSSAYGLGGRPRRTGDPAERARTAVTARIRDAIRRIEELHPELGRHLRVSVRTGTLCIYEPDRPASWTLT